MRLLTSKTVLVSGNALSLASRRRRLRTAVSDSWRVTVDGDAVISRAVL
jgi:hypothetical protein